MSARKELKPSPALYPAPVILVTSVDENDKPNIITLAWAANLCTVPPQIGISVGRKSFSNGLIRKVGEFVVNIPTVDILKETDYCGLVSGKKVDKFKDTKLTPVKATHVKPPIIKQCPVSIECRVKNTINIGSEDLFIGETLGISIDESILDQRKNVDFGKLKAISYSPLSLEYYGMGEKLGQIGFSMKK